MNGIKIDYSLLIYVIIIGIIILISGFIIKKILEKKYKEEMILINYKVNRFIELFLFLLLLIASIIVDDYIFVILFSILSILFFYKQFLKK